MILNLNTNLIPYGITPQEQVKRQSGQDARTAGALTSYPAPLTLSFEPVPYLPNMGNRISICILPDLIYTHVIGLTDIKCPFQF